MKQPCEHSATVRVAGRILFAAAAACAFAAPSLAENAAMLVLEPHDVRVVCDGVAAPEVKRNHTFVQLGKVSDAQRAACAVEVDFLFRDTTVKENFRTQWARMWAKNGYVEFMALGRPRPSFPNRVNAAENVSGVTLGEITAPRDGYRVRVALTRLLAEADLTQAWLMIGNRFGAPTDTGAEKSYFSVSMHFDAGDPRLSRKQAKQPNLAVQ